MNILKFPTKLPAPERIGSCKDVLFEPMCEMRAEFGRYQNQLMAATNAAELAAAVRGVEQLAAETHRYWAAVSQEIREKWGI